VSARLHLGGAPVIEPAARLDSPGLAVVYLTATDSYLAFTAPGAAREVAAACTRAAELLEGPQVVPAT
jgi:hypothetical protein